MNRKTNKSVPCFSLGMLPMRICYLALALNTLKHSGEGPIWHFQGPFNNLTSGTMRFCSICPCNCLLTPAYLCMVVKITCRGPIGGIKISPNMSPIQAFTLTRLCIALKDMNTSSWVSNIVNGWNRVEECIDWCIPIFREAICVRVSM